MFCFNSCIGYTCSIHVHVLLLYFYAVNEFGKVVPTAADSPVPIDILRKLYNILGQGISMESCIDVLRPLTVPNGYS